MSAKPASGGGAKSLVIAVMVALIGMLMMQRYLTTEKARIETSVVKVAVLVAEKSIEQGEAIKSADLGFRMVAADDQPWSTIKFDDPASSRDAQRRFEDIKATLNGQVVNRAVARNDILLYTDIEGPPKERLSSLFSGRQRAVAVVVNSASLMGGLLQPNDRVDVLATFPAGMEIRGGITEPHDKTKVILEDITVLAVGSRMGAAALAGGRGGNTVTLALAPEQAMLLSHVQNTAEISLLLRPLDAVQAGRFDRMAEVSSQNSVEDLIKDFRSNPK